MLLFLQRAQGLMCRVRNAVVVDIEIKAHDTLAGVNRERHAGRCESRTSLSHVYNLYCCVRRVVHETNRENTGILPSTHIRS